MKRWIKLTHCKRCSSLLPTGKNVYCSDECFRLARNEQQMVKNEKYSVELTCDLCSSKFMRSKYRLNRSKGNFCNRSCASKFYKANGTYDKWLSSAKDNAKGDYVLCAGCGVMQMYRSPHDIVNNRQRCCNRKCFGLFITKTQSGENHPAWGTRMSDASKRQREQTCLDRYGVTCGFMNGKNMSPSKGQLSLHSKLEKLDVTLLPPEQLVQTAIGHFRVDALFPNQKLIVEYNGDWWHANPNVYKANDFVGVDYSTRAEDVWARDARRKTALEAAGYRVHIVWERDWKQNPVEQLESIKMELERLE